MSNLIGYWPLQDDLEDHSSLGHKTINHNVKSDSNGAIFNGCDSFLEIPSSKALQLGTGEFTITAEIFTENILNDVIGDIASKYDDGKCNGFNLSVMHHAGVVSSQTNYRNLAFGIDDGTKPVWQDCGRLGNAETVWSLAVYNGQLFAGTYEGGKGCGHVYRYNGKNWVDSGILDGSNNVAGMAVFNGKLYAATQHHDAHGSLLSLSENNTPGGKVFRYEGDDNWVDCGKVCDADNLLGLVVYENELYTMPMYAIGVYRYEGGTRWSRIDSPNSRFLSMAVYNGYLYATANRLELLKSSVTHAGPKGDHRVQKVVGTDGVFRYSKKMGWQGCGNQGEATQLYASAIHKGQIYTGSWPDGKVYRYLGAKKWEDCGSLNNEQEVMGMVVYNGKLYAGSLPSARVYRFDGVNEWETIGCVDYTSNVPLRRALNMSVYQGRLYVGTLPSGHVYAMEAGKNVTYDYELASGWRKIAAVKCANRLEIYIDSQRVAVSSQFNLKEYDLFNDKPLRIGFGSNDYFYGRIKNFRLYNKALKESVVS